MNGPIERWENRLQAVAQGFPYPPTPDIASTVGRRLAPAPGPVHRQRALAASMLVLVLLAGLLAVPSVRAAVIEFLQIGVIRVLIPEPTPTPSPSPTLSPAATITDLSITTLTPFPTPRDLISLDELIGETTLEEAIQRSSFTLRLPSYPPDLGAPDRVFLQDMGGDVVILAWTTPSHPEKAELILYQIASGSWAGVKVEPVQLQQTQVNGREAIWAEGPYTVQLTDGNLDIRRLVTGRVLLWEENNITYRLESNLSLGEAIKIAESLRSPP